MADTDTDKDTDKRDLDKTLDDSAGEDSGDPVLEGEGDVVGDSGVSSSESTLEASSEPSLEPRTLETRDPERASGHAPRSNVIGGLALLLALVALGLAGLTSYKTFYGTSFPGGLFLDVDANEDAELDALRRQLEVQSTRVSALDRRIDQAGALNQGESSGGLENLAEQLLASRRELDQEIQAVRAELEDNVSRLSATVAETRQEVADRRTTKARDWLLAEVEYLIRMANQRNLMDKDPEGAISLLRAADEIIANTEELTAHRLRQAIAEDIVSLSSVDDIDVEGIFLLLDAEIRAVSELRRRLPEYIPPSRNIPPEVKVSAEESSDGVVDAMTRGLVRFGHSLSGLIDFRRNVPSIEPILPPQEEYYLRQNLILKLQLAQLGLLEERQQVFSLSVGDAVTWLDRYFDGEHPATTAMRSALEEIRNTDVVRDLPAITASLREARNLLADFDRAPEA